MRLGQGNQALQGAEPVDTPVSKKSVRPGGGLWADQTATIEPVPRSLLDAAALMGVDMSVARCETARFGAGVGGDDLLAMIEHTNDPGLATDPNLPPQILRRDGVVRLVKLDVAVAMDLPPRFDKAGKKRVRQR